MSECPYLSGVYGAAVSEGLQRGEDPRFLLAVSGLKHFAAYSLEQYGPPSDPAEWTRQTFNALVTPFDAADSYFPAFKRAIQAGGAAGVMYAVNEWNGVPGCAFFWRASRPKSTGARPKPGRSQTRTLTPTPTRRTNPN